MLPRRCVLSHLAVAWPPLATLTLAVLIVICHVVAINRGECDREKDGKTDTAYVTEISLTAETPPTSYIWTLGVWVVWCVLLCPVAALVHEVFRQSRNCYVLIAVAELLFLLATLLLVGLATVTNKGTFLEDENTIEEGHMVHRRLADLFFLATYFHGGLFLAWQGWRCRDATRLEKSSCIVKLSLLCFLALSVSGLIPLLVLAIAPEDALRPTDEIEKLNERGLAQRFVVFGIMLFVASYALDVKALQRRMQDSRASKHAEETAKSWETHPAPADDHPSPPEVCTVGKKIEELS